MSEPVAVLLGITATLCISYLMVSSIDRKVQALDSIISNLTTRLRAIEKGMQELSLKIREQHEDHKPRSDG